MWSKITRQKYEREGQRYASDLTDAEWALIEPHMPPAKRLDRPRGTELRSVLDAILHLTRSGLRVVDNAKDGSACPMVCASARELAVREGPLGGGSVPSVGDRLRRPGAEGRWVYDAARNQLVRVVELTFA